MRCAVERALALVRTSTGRDARCSPFILLDDTTREEEDSDRDCECDCETATVAQVNGSAPSGRWLPSCCLFLTHTVVV